MIFHYIEQLCLKLLMKKEATSSCKIKTWSWIKILFLFIKNRNLIKKNTWQEEAKLCELAYEMDRWCQPIV